MLKKINTPIRYQHLTEDPNFTSYFQFSDPGGGNPRQLDFPPGRYFLLFGGKVDGFRIQTRDGSGEWTFTDVTANPYLHEVKFTSTGAIMARKTDKAIGDAHMVIIAPPQLADLFAGRWQHGIKTYWYGASNARLHNHCIQRIVGRLERANYRAMGGNGQQFHHPHPWTIQGRSTRQPCHVLPRPYRIAAQHQSRRNCPIGQENTLLLRKQTGTGGKYLCNTTGLATVGGGA